MKTLNTFIFAAIALSATVAMAQQNNRFENPLKNDRELNYSIAMETQDNGESKNNLKKESKLNPKSNGDGNYTTAIGLRGGFTSGVTLKHFIKDNAALEIILGTRWHGLSITGLYELHKGNAFDVPQLTWEYGIGARIGFYRGRAYYNYRNCNNPNDPRCNPYYYDRSITAIGLVGIGGLEYHFNEIPFTISLDLMPYFYFNHWGGGFLDGSMSVRYVLK